MEQEYKYFYEVIIGEPFEKPKYEYLFPIDDFEKEEQRGVVIFRSRKKIISISKKTILSIKFRMKKMVDLATINGTK